MPFALLLVTALLAADQAKPILDQAALKKLEGKWQLTRREHGGANTDAKEIKAVTVEVKGTTLIIRDGAEVKEEAVITGLNPKAVPATLDLKITKGTGKGDGIAGIYKLDGETLRIGIAEPGKDRPTKLEGAAGTGHTLLVLKKAK